MSSSSSSTFSCHACGGEVPVLAAPALRFLVGSDCTPVTGDIRVGACRACGLMQKEISPAWKKLCDQIYGNYRIYHQAAGHEQKARGAAGGELKPRSDLIAGFLRKSSELPRVGSVMDIGCGNGAYLRAMSKAFPEWTVTGTDLNDTFRSEVCAISPRATFLNSTELESSGATFDIVSLIHCIEHIPSPVAYLADARRHLKPNGLLLIEVPDAELNPFDLVVGDHSSHLSKATLASIVEAAGYDVVDCGNLVVGKEITLLARPLHGKPVGRMPNSEATAMQTAVRNLGWLDSIYKLANQLARDSRPFGIFGTSIAGVWIGSALETKIDFYVDEDEIRFGRDYFDVPIISPDAIPSGSTVFICLEPRLAATIAKRHDSPERRFVVPPPLL